jgi:hypothetical protein
MQGTVRYARNPNFIFRQIVDETVLVPLHHDVADMESIYALNPVGAFIWKALEEPTTHQALHALILTEYDADSEELMADLDQFLSEMTAIGAIRKV